MSINLDDFREEGRREDIKIDKEKVRQRKKVLEQIGQRELVPSKKRSMILEALLAEQIEASDWFGHNANTVIASEFDDLFNSIDLVIEFGSEGEKDIHYNPMGIDVTSTTERIGGKLTKIRDHFKRWGGSRIKYFRSERKNPKSKLKELPRLIIGVEPELIEELGQLWLEANRHRLEGKNPLKLSEEERQKIKEAREKLAKHRAASLLLEELRLQLQCLVEFAKNIKRDPNKFDRLLTIVEELLKLKKLDPSEESQNNQDKIYRAICTEIEKVFSLL